MAKKKIKVLFFIAGMVATDDEEAAMNKFSAKHTICIRNASMIHDGDNVEPFDVVAGAVPPSYAAAAKEKKPEPEAPKAPKADAGKVDKRSPAAPPPPVVEPKEGDETPPVVEGEGGKPKPPEPTPGAGAGWKPNA